MKQLFPLLFAAAIGSAATYFIMEAKHSSATVEAPATAIAPEKAPASKFASKSATASPETPASDSPRKSGGSKFAGKGGFLPEEIDGVTPEQLNKCKVALFKTYQEPAVQEARAKIAELRKEAEYASDDEKKNLRTQFEDATLEVRKATKAAVLAADAELSEDVVDKVLDAVEERMKQRLQNGKKK